MGQNRLHNLNSLWYKFLFFISEITSDPQTVIRIKSGVSLFFALKFLTKISSHNSPRVAVWPLAFIDLPRCRCRRNRNQSRAESRARVFFFAFSLTRSDRRGKWKCLRPVQYLVSGFLSHNVVIDPMFDFVKPTNTQAYARIGAEGNVFPGGDIPKRKGCCART